MKDLEICRKEINEIDAQLMALFEMRMSIVKDVVLYKQQYHLPIYQAYREEELLKKNLSYIKSSEIKPYASLFIQNLMDVSKKYQNDFCDTTCHKNVVLIGMMGCGKTTIGRLVAEKLNRPFIDVDEFIVEQNHMSIEEMFERGESYFRERETACIEQLSLLDGYVIACGGGVVLSDYNMQLLKKKGVIVYIDRPLECIMNDINREGRPLLRDGYDKLEIIFKQRQSMYESYGDIHIMNCLSIDDCVCEIKRKIEEL